MHPFTAELHHILVSHCSEEISLHLIMIGLQGSHSNQPHSSWQETINSWLR